jgi:hypothetical protein
MVEMFDEFVDYVLTDCESTGRPNDLNRVCPWGVRCRFLNFPRGPLANYVKTS